jgi:1-acyl-sn-glycerol-3-phosphate acyltransferase
MNLVYKTCSLALRNIWGILYRTDWHGLRHIPEDGPLLVVCNHTSFFDPPLLGAVKVRDFHFLARETLLSNPVAKWLLPRLNTIPVDRDGGKDAKAVSKVLKVLSKGEAVVVYPEGTRSPDGEIHPAKAGIGLIACRSRANILPMRIVGAYDIYSRHRKIPSIRGKLDVIFGPVLTPADYDPGRKSENRFQEAIDRAMEAVARLEVPY